MIDDTSTSGTRMIAQAQTKARADDLISLIILLVSSNMLRMMLLRLLRWLLEFPWFRTY